MKKKSAATEFFLVILLAISVVFVFSEADAAELTIPIPKGDHDKGLRTAIDWYVPRNHVISVGDIVTWTNEDLTSHTVTSGQGIGISSVGQEEEGKPNGIFDSGIINPGESWSFTFTDAGEFPYFCTLHPWIQRSITVIDVEETVNSPNKQLKDGIASHNIKCKKEYNLVFKATDLKPSCVRESSVKRLVEVGWALPYDPYPLNIMHISNPDEIYFTLQGENSVSSYPSGTELAAGNKMTYLDTTNDGSILLASSSADNAVFVFYTVSKKQIAKIEVGMTPKGVKVHPDEEVSFVANEGSGNISVIDMGDWQVIEEIPVGKVPHNISFSPDRNTAYVTLQGEDAVAVIDVSSLTVVDLITVGKQPHNLDVAPDGVRLFVANIGTSDVAVIDLASKDIIKRIPVSKGHHGIDMPLFGNQVIVSGIGSDIVNIIDANSLELVKQVEVGSGPHGIRTSSDGTKAYVGVTGTNELVIIDLDSFEIEDRIKVGKTPFWISVPLNP